MEQSKKICPKEYHTKFGYQSVTPTVKNDLFSICEWQAIFSDGVANNFPTIISIDKWQFFASTIVADPFLEIALRQNFCIFSSSYFSNANENKFDKGSYL